MTKYQEAMEWLANLKSEGDFVRSGGYVPSVKIVNEFLDALGRPEKNRKHRVIIGGSAGKGSVCRYIERTLLSEGKTVTMISSPHLQVITERIRINGKLINSENFGTMILNVRAIGRKIQKTPTYYEANVLAGILASEENKSEVLLLEVGCGGDFDATHAVAGSRIAGVTFIGHDHLDIFGGSLEHTAFAKSGIFDVPDLVAAFSCEKVFREIFNKRSKIPIKYLSGMKPKLNKKLARKICEVVLGYKDFVMQQDKAPCRWEKIPNSMITSFYEKEVIKKIEKNQAKIILDGAHSKERFEYILPKIKKLSGKKIGILSMKYTGNLEDLKIIIPYFDMLFLTSNETDKTARRLADIKDLKKIVPEGIEALNPKDALKKALDSVLEPSTILVMGSLYLCSEIRDNFYDPEKILEMEDEYLKKI